MPPSVTRQHRRRRSRPAGVAAHGARVQRAQHRQPHQVDEVDALSRRVVRAPVISTTTAMIDDDKGGYANRPRMSAPVPFDM